MSKIVTSCTIQIDSRVTEMPKIQYFSKPNEFFSVSWGFDLTLIMSIDQLRALREVLLRDNPIISNQVCHQCNDRLAVAHGPYTIDDGLCEVCTSPDSKI